MDILIGLACYAAPQAPLPTSSAQRRALAQKLVARLDTLTAAEEGTLGQLGDDAFDALLPRLKADLLGTIYGSDWFVVEKKATWFS